MENLSYSLKQKYTNYKIVKHLPIDLGLEIRSARKKNFMTQQEVADEIDISVKLYQKYEYNICRPPLETVFKIFNLLGISAYDLQKRLKPDSLLYELNCNPNRFSQNDFWLKISNKPHLYKVNEALLKIECPECLEIIAKINYALSSIDKLQMKRKLILLKKIIK